MTRSPDRDDRRLILKLAEQGVSVRRIAKIVMWSRPTVSKILSEEGFDPKKGKLSTPPLGAQEAPEGGFDFEEEMEKVDQELKQWWDGLSVEQQDEIIAQGPAEDRETSGFLDKNY